MAIDARNEDVFSLTQAAERAEAIIGKRLATSTIYRWATRGVKGVQLETRFLGGTRYTSLEALQRFFDATTKAAGLNPGISSNNSRDAAIRHAENQLADI